MSSAILALVYSVLLFVGTIMYCKHDEKKEREERRKRFEI